MIALPHGTVISVAFCLGCAASHVDYPAEVGLSPETGLPCGADDPPTVIGSCDSDTFRVACHEWVQRRTPTGLLGYVACRPSYPCVRGTDGDEARGYHCGDRPACGVGQVCVITAGLFPNEVYGCVCGVGAP